MKIGIRSILFVIVMCSHPALARDILYSKAKETLPISFGVETLFRFPMEVKTITEAERFEIKPANPEEPDYSVLAVKPRMREGVSDVTFVLSDGSVIRTQLITSLQRNLKKDSIYDFKPKDELLNSNPNLSDKREPLVISELDLMRAMISGDRLAGFDTHVVDQTIDLNSKQVGKDLSVHLIKSYIGNGVNGFIYRVKTRSKEQVYSVNLEKLAIGQPNLALLAQIDHPAIGGDSAADRETLLRVVTKPGASARKVVLPTAIQREDKS